MLHKKIITSDNCQAFCAWLTDHLVTESQSKQMFVKFGELNQTRSMAQNRLLWKWHGELRRHIEECTGVIPDNDAIHEYVISKLGEIEIKNVAGEEITIREKTSKMTIKRFAEFLNLYERWAREKYNLIFSHPDDLYWHSMGVNK